MILLSAPLQVLLESLKATGCKNNYTKFTDEIKSRASTKCKFFFPPTVTATKYKQSHTGKVVYFAPQILLKDCKATRLQLFSHVFVRSKIVPELGEYS